MLNSNAIHGLGDLMINYRYQLTGNEAWATLAPRLSISFPTADESRGIGSGATAWQFNLPASKRLNAFLVAHMNAGATLFPGMKTSNGAGAAMKKSLWSYNLGGSVIALLSEKFNFMLEVVAQANDELDEVGRVVKVTETIVSPGVRYAIDIGSLQIVPGLALPVTFGEGDSKSGFFSYLSLEHPF